MTFSPSFQRVFPATFDRRAAAAAAGNGLLNALIAYWPGNEASGNLQDAHSNALHLTDVNTVTNETGKVYATARQYTAANSEYHERPGDDALLSAGDVDFTLAAWVYFLSVNQFRGVAGKLISAGQYEYSINLTNAARMRWTVSSDGTALINREASSFGVAVINTWYFIVGWHDSVANTINIQINNGVVDSTNHATGVFDGSNKFQVGNFAGVAAMNGRIGPVAMWKSAAGGGGVLSAAQRTSLWNAGAGLAYAQFTT